MQKIEMNLVQPVILKNIKKDICFNVIYSQKQVKGQKTLLCCQYLVFYMENDQ